jgi:hypothetical protein
MHFVAVCSSEVTLDVRNLVYSNNTAGIHFKQVQNNGTSEFLRPNKSDFETQGHRNPHTNDINTPTYERTFLQNSVTYSDLAFTLHNTSGGEDELSRREAGVETSEEKANIKSSWKELMKNDTLAFIIWNVTNKHFGFKSRDESVEKCLEEFSDRRTAIAPYLVSTTLRENGYFLRDFIHQISRYSHLHDLRAVQNYYDEFKEIMVDHRSYYAALKEIILNMDQEMKSSIICAQRRFCSCFSSQDVVRYEEQFSFLAQYNFLLGTYLICGYYIDPIIRGIFIVTGLILNCITLIIFVRYKDRIIECDVMVMNIAVNGILTLTVYVPLQYIHFYYSSVIPHEEFSSNSDFIAIQTALISVSGMSLVALRAQHYLEVSKALNTTVPWWSLPTPWQSILGIFTVWVLAFSVATLTYVFNDHPKFGYIFPPLVYVVLYILILPIVMNRFKLYTEKDLVPPEQEKIISSHVIVEISKVFWMTHIPLFVWQLLEGLCGFALRLVSVNYSYVEIVFCYVYFSYTYGNTLTLCRTSYGFRKLLYRHLFRCWYNPTEVQDVRLTEARECHPGTESPP